MTKSKIDTKTIIIAVLVVAVIALGVYAWQEQRTERVEIEFGEGGIAVEGPDR